MSLARPVLRSHWRVAWAPQPAEPLPPGRTPGSPLPWASVETSLGLTQLIMVMAPTADDLNHDFWRRLVSPNSSQQLFHEGKKSNTESCFIWLFVCYVCLFFQEAQWYGCVDFQIWPCGWWRQIHRSPLPTPPPCVGHPYQCFFLIHFT